LQHQRKPEKKEHTMSLVIEKALNAVDEADAERDTALLAQDEGKAVERKQDIAAKATAMTGTTTVTDRLKEQSKQRSRKTPERAAKDAARKAARQPAKPKPVKRSVRGAGNGSGPVARITESWVGKDRKEVAIKDHVAHGEFVGIVKGRWTRKAKDQLIPMVTLILDKPQDKDKPRHNAPAAECVHVK